MPTPTPTTKATKLLLATNHAAIEIPWLEKSLEGFQRSHSNVSVEIVNSASGYLEQIGSWAAETRLPDVLYVRARHSAAWAYRQWLRPLDDLVKRDAATLDLGDLLPTFTDELRYQERWVLLPSSCSVTTLFFNSALFQEASVGAPQPGWGWAELLGAARQIVKVGGGHAARWGLSWRPDHVAMAAIWRAENAGVFVPEGLDVSGPECVAATQALADLMSDASAPKEDDLASGAAALVSGTVAVEANGSWAIGQYRSTDQTPLAVALPPLGTAKQIAAAPTSSGWGLSRDARDRDLAGELVKHLSGKDSIDVTVTLPLRDLPARGSSTQLWLDGVKAIGGPRGAELIPALAGEARPLPNVPWWLDYQDAFEELMPTVWNGKRKASDVLPELQKRVNAAAARFH